MSTVATPEMRAFAADWKKEFPSAQLSGIVGDLAHKLRGGYHISREDQPATNYSVVRPDDKLGPDDAAAAVDMTMSKADMVTCTNRLIQAFDNPGDPRRKYLNAFNGWTGEGDARRWDVYGRKVELATNDHQWHVHLSMRRRYVKSATAFKAVLSILRGETVMGYLASIGVKLVPPAYPGHLLRRSEVVDPAFKLFQQQMLNRGWSSIGQPDGVFGEKGEDVVKRWQQTCKIEADGVIGPATWPTPWTVPLGGSLK